MPIDDIDFPQGARDGAANAGSSGIPLPVGPGPRRGHRSIAGASTSSTRQSSRSAMRCAPTQSPKAVRGRHVKTSAPQNDPGSAIIARLMVRDPRKTPHRMSVRSFSILLTRCRHSVGPEPDIKKMEVSCPSGIQVRGPRLGASVAGRQTPGDAEKRHEHRFSAPPHSIFAAVAPYPCAAAAPALSRHR